MDHGLEGNRLEISPGRRGMWLLTTMGTDNPRGKKRRGKWGRQPGPEGCSRPVWGGGAGQTRLRAVPVGETEGDKLGLLHAPVSLPSRPPVDGHGRCADGSQANQGGHSKWG